MQDLIPAAQLLSAASQPGGDYGAAKAAFLEALRGSPADAAAAAAVGQGVGAEAGEEAGAAGQGEAGAHVATKGIGLVADDLRRQVSVLCMAFVRLPVRACQAPVAFTCLTNPALHRVSRTTAGDALHTVVEVKRHANRDPSCSPLLCQVEMTPADAPLVLGPPEPAPGSTAGTTNSTAAQGGADGAGDGSTTGAGGTAGGTAGDTSSALPALRDLQGRWSGRIEVFGGAAGATNIDFALQGEDWR